MVWIVGLAELGSWNFSQVSAACLTVYQDWSIGLSSKVLVIDQKPNNMYRVYMNRNKTV